ncbi:MAG TPA: hypothetical protein VFT61_06440 [Sphingomicrobium sp.]|nr:hypothetical protein [Sphingomicrobium sp.]
MNQNVESESGQSDGPSIALPTIDDFNKSGLNTFLESYSGADSYEFEDALSTHAASAEPDSADARVFAFVANLMSCHMKLDDPAEPFGPKLIMDGQRTMIPSDIRGEQSDVIAAILPTIPHASVRARLGDIAFYNDRSHHQAGRIAIDAYCEIVTRRMAGTLACRLPDLGLTIHDIVVPMKRAVQLTRLLHKREQVPSVVQEAFEAAYAKALADSKYFPFVELAELAETAGLLPLERVISDAVKLASSATPDEYPEAVKRVWIHAANCSLWLGRSDEEREFRIKAAEQTLKMRDHCSGAMAHAHWTKVAIGEFRQISGMKDRVAGLLDELRQLQMAARDEMSAFSMPIDLSEERKGAIELFESVSLPEAMIELLRLVSPPDVGELRRIVLENAKSSPLSSIMAASYHDAEGKEVARVAAAPFNSEPSEEWYKAQSIRHMDVIRLMQVRGRLEPGRRTIMDRFPIEERHVAPVAYLSPFVPKGHAPLFCLGFARMFQGDYVSAAHILFPQLEAALRHVLIISNRDPSKIESDLLQGDRTLSGMLESNRDDLEAVFGPDVIHEIDLLFNFRPGPAMRHELAHGKMPYGSYWEPDAIWGCWLMFNLTCRPLLRNWNEQIAPEIEANL